MFRAINGRSSGMAWVHALWIEGRRPYLGLLAAAMCALMSLSAWSQDAPRFLTNGGELAGDNLKILVGHQTALQTPWRVKRVSVSDPRIADVAVQETNEVLIVAKSAGVTDLILWGEDGEVWSATIEVDIDIDGLNEDLLLLFPRTGVNVSRSQNVYVVKGTLERSEQAQQLENFLKA